MRVNVERAQFAKKVERQNEQKDELVQYAISLGCFACRNKFRFGKKRLDRLVRGMFREITDYYEHYGGNPEEGLDPENVPTLYYGLRNQVKCLDIPVEEIEAKFALSEDFEREHRNSMDRAMRKARYDFVMTLEKVTRSMWYAMILHLWHYYGNGGVALTSLYKQIQWNWSNTMELYLTCKKRYDETFATTIAGATKDVKDLGVEF